MSDEFDESPLASRLAESAAGAGDQGGTFATTSTSTSTSAGGQSSAPPSKGSLAQPDEEDGEDTPDWIAFADFARSLAKGKNKESSSFSSNPVIPKRGEKDFEPASEERYQDLQQSLLGASREALFSAISSGSRQHSSKAYNRAIWDEGLKRAYMVAVDDPALPPLASAARLQEGRPLNLAEGEVREDAPSSLTSSSSTSKTVLEDTAAAISTLQSMTTASSLSQATVHGVHFLTMGHYQPSRKRIELLPEEALYLIERGSIECWTSEDRFAVPMSVQHAWSAMIMADELNPERYQVYAFLRRLGYTVVRSKPDTSSLVVDKPKGVHAKMLHSRSKLHVILDRLLYAPKLIVRTLRAYVAPWTLTPLQRLEELVRGTRTSILGNSRWFTYDQIFSSLQFVKAGRGADMTGNKRHTNPYSVFFNIYKPITKFKKTDPPPPDFRIGVISAQTTLIPDLWDFQNIFEDLEESGGDVMKEAANTFLQDVYSRFKSLFARSEATEAFSGKGPSKRKPHGASLTRPAPYAKLKTGSKSAIIAVVDNGTISFQRFGETDFSELPWVGAGNK